MSKEHFSRLFKLVENIEGVYVECGIGGCVSMSKVSELFTRGEAKTRTIYGYDSFVGLPTPSIHDNYYPPGRTGHPRSTLDRIIEKYSNLTYNITEGWFKDTLHTYPKEPIAILHLDVDVYMSYKECLETLYQYVQPGGLILFDEYTGPNDLRKWPGAKRAIDEFFEPLNLPILIDTLSEKAYLIKPLI